MTVCVYHKNVLAADSMITSGNLVVQNDFVKIGKIYQDLVSKKRSTDPTLLDFPEEFAMYAVAGSLRFIPRFLRWFVSVSHPDIDHHNVVEPSDQDETEEAIEVLMIFKDHDIIRHYDSDYIRDVYVDIPKSKSTAIGSGAEAAYAIINYDANANLPNLVQAVSSTNTHCGGSVEVLTFGETFEHDPEKLQKAMRIYEDEQSSVLMDTLKELGIDVQLNVESHEGNDSSEESLLPSEKLQKYFF